MSQGQHAIARGLQVMVDLEREVQLAGGAADCLEPTPANFRAFTLAWVGEIIEVLQETNWKMWKRDRPIDKGKILAEFADVLAFQALVLHYLMELTGSTAAEFASAFADKSAVNIERLSGRIEGYGYGKAAGVVLAGLPEAGAEAEDSPAGGGTVAYKTVDQARQAWPPQSYPTHCSEGHTLEWTSGKHAVCYTPVAGGHQPTWWQLDGMYLVPDTLSEIQRYHPNWRESDGQRFRRLGLAAGEAVHGVVQP